ncbi:response regulator [Anaeromyxobacter sp. Fw109-5]|uniref:hybrid sensor histidine kinase/response regulator n=1 Tax=Anaeromyxobacter sp. (strain Fw109-5) TaxID=404589 RepID=UPI0000ED72F8|nr:response regulator [Anaeromyxobacter sp. Fw109-5]ABS26499.1 CheA signal transduction histidine kinase [Anaeromyxobacter sp. Fw109-5]
MDRDALLQSLRNALASDLGEQVRVLEEGVVALEKAEPGPERDALLADVFRAAHGLKGSARAAGVAPMEATCHAMESLLGAARDHARTLGREDFAALLAAVDALSEVQKRLSEEPAAEVEEALFASARELLRSRIEGTPPATSSAAPRAGHPERSVSAPAETRSGGTPAPPAAPGAGHPESFDSAASGRYAQDKRSRGTPTTSPASAPSPPRPDAGRSERPRRSGALRLAPERLDAIAVAGGGLLASAFQAEARATRADELARDARKLRAALRAARPILARAAAVRHGRAAVEATAARAALAVEDDLGRLERGLSALRGQLAVEARALERRTRRLASDVRALRLTPWLEATAGLERAARDVAAARARDVEVVVGGEGLELDRSVVDALREPLGQLVRNAVDHGIEDVAERRAAGKPERGRIEVDARIEGERVFVRVRDDGRGLDPERLREEARRRGLPVPADRRRALELVFVPGFSTATQVTELSGRGVGLDVVASAVRAMRGTVGLSSSRGHGTCFELAVPTTLYGLRAVVVRDAGQVFAIPALDVERVFRLRPEQVATSGGRPMLLAGEPAPLAPLAPALGLSSETWRVEDRRMAVLVEANGQRAAFAVDEVLAERELSLEPLSGRLEGLTLASAVAVLPGGDLAVVLASRELVELAHGAQAPSPAPPREAAPARRRVLLADDAATTRALARSLLEASGFEVIPAGDGEQAWSLLQQHGADVVVSDVEMPRMSGFELTRAIRQSPRFARLPVVLLTALESEGDRRRGLEAGADAYLVKATFDQRVLLDTIAELLEEVP